MQLLDVTTLGGNCSCKSGHACNYTDAYVSDLLLPLLRRIVPLVEAEMPERRIIV